MKSIPNTVFPLAIDNDYTLFRVFNSSQSSLSKDITAKDDIIPILPQDANDADVWGDNGFVTIKDELIYYDTVTRDKNGKISELKDCIRGIEGNPTAYRAGTHVAANVVAQTHNQLVDAVMAIEDAIGDISDMLKVGPKLVTQQKVRKNLLSPRKQLVADVDLAFTASLNQSLSAMLGCASIGNDNCPDIEFDFNMVGTTAEYCIRIFGNYNTFELDFGDGITETQNLAGTHDYMSAGPFNPTVTVEAATCCIVQSPTAPNEFFSDAPSTPSPSVPFVINIPDFPAVPNVVVPKQICPGPLFNFPPLIMPDVNTCSNQCSGISVTVSITAPSSTCPSVISVFSPCNPSITVSFEGLSLPSVISLVGCTIPSSISFDCISFCNLPSFSCISFCEPPSFSAISFGPPPSFSAISFATPPSLCVSFCPTECISFCEPPSFSCISFCNLPSFSTISFGTPPSFACVSFCAPPSICVSICSTECISFCTPPSFSAISFCTPPSFSAISFGTPPSFGCVSFCAPPSICISICSTECISFCTPPSFSAISFATPPSFGCVSFCEPPSFASVTFAGPPSFNCISFCPPPSFASVTFGTPPSFGCISFCPPPSFASVTFGTPPSFGCVSFCPPPSFASVTFGTPPSFDVISFATPPSFGCVSFCPLPSLNVTFGTTPSFNAISFATAPSFDCISFCTPPSFAPISFATPPSITVSWGVPPVVSCIVQVQCPSTSNNTTSSGGSAPLGMAPFMEAVPFTMPEIDSAPITMGSLGIPEEIRLIVPRIPEQIRLVGLNQPIPNEITIKGDIPRSIQLNEHLVIDGKDIPRKILVEPAPNFPSTLKLEVTGMPQTLQVTGIPPTISVVGDIPRTIQLLMPEKPEVAMKWDGVPVELKPHPDLEKLFSNFVITPR